MYPLNIKTKSYCFVTYSLYATCTLFYTEANPNTFMCISIVSVLPLLFYWWKWLFCVFLPVHGFCLILRQELEEIHKNVLQQREKFQNSGLDKCSVSSINNFHMNTRFVLNGDEACYLLSVELQSPIDNILIQVKRYILCLIGWTYFSLYIEWFKKSKTYLWNEKISLHMSVFIFAKCISLYSVDSLWLPLGVFIFMVTT